MTFPRLPLPEELSLEVFASESLYTEDLLEGLLVNFGECRESDIEAIVSLAESIEQIVYCFRLYNWQISATSGSSQNISEIELFLDNEGDSVPIITANAHITSATLLLMIGNALLPDLTEDIEDINAFVSERFDKLEYELSGMRCGECEVLRLIATLDRERACLMDQYYDLINEPNQGEPPAPGTDPRYQNLTSDKMGEIIGYSGGRVRQFIKKLGITKGDDGYFTIQGLSEIISHIQSSPRPGAVHQSSVKQAREYIDSLEEASD